MEHYIKQKMENITHLSHITKDMLSELAEFIRLVHSENSKFNLTGHKTPEEISDNLIIESLSPVDFTDVPRGTSVADMGTGAGVPGVPLAICFPDVEFTLFDSNSKKIRFIDYVSETLNLKNVRTVCGRIEEISRLKEYREQFDAGVSRAMSDVYTAGELCSPFIKPGGVLYLYVSDKQKQLPAPAIEHLKKVSLEINEGNATGPLRVKTKSGLLLYKTSNIADTYPRRISAIRRGSSEAEKTL